MKKINKYSLNMAIIGLICASGIHATPFALRSLLNGSRTLLQSTRMLSNSARPQINKQLIALPTQAEKLTRDENRLYKSIYGFITPELSKTYNSLSKNESQLSSWKAVKKAISTKTAKNQCNAHIDRLENSIAMNFDKMEFLHGKLFKQKEMLTKVKQDTTILEQMQKRFEQILKSNVKQEKKLHKAEKDSDNSSENFAKKMKNHDRFFKGIMTITVGTCLYGLYDILCA